VRIIKIIKHVIIILILITTLLTGCANNNNINWGDAPDFTLTTVYDDTFTLSDHLGKVIIIDLMATWCVPCQRQMSQLEALVNESGDKIVVVSVDIDQRETANDIKVIFGKYIDKWTFVLDNDEGYVSKAYQVSSIPKIVIVDKKGNIYYTHVGYIEHLALSTKIAGLLE